MKGEDLFAYMDPVIPSDFFFHEFHIKKGELTLLSDLTFLMGEDCFSEFFLGASVEALFGKIVVHKKFEEASFTAYQQSDSVEIYLNTRPVRGQTVPTCFCHHFLFLPVKIEGFFARELTTFRGDEQRRLAEPGSIKIEALYEEASYSILFEIPVESIHGFNLAEFSKIGFAYKINSKGGKKQHFPTSSIYRDLEKNPGSFATITFT